MLKHDHTSDRPATATNAATLKVTHMLTIATRDETQASRNTLAKGDMPDDACTHSVSIFS